MMADSAAPARTTDPSAPGHGHHGDERLRVMIVEDHAVFAEALAMALETSGRLRCVGVASTAREAITLAARAQPDRVVMDLGLGEEDGTSLTRELLVRHPDLRILVLTGQTPSAPLVRVAVDAGAAGFLHKAVSLDVVVDAVGSLSAGCLTVDRQTVTTLCAPAPPTTSRGDGPPGLLTRREHDILELLGSGVDLQNASRHLGISVNTSRGYVKNLYRKLGVHSQLELLAVARKRGLVGDGGDGPEADPGRP